MEVYRYMNFEKLRDIVENKTLYFVNPFEMWTDKKEGFLYRAAKECDELVKINKELEQHIFKDSILEQLQNGVLYKEKASGEVLDWFGMRCQSWSKSENNHRMWKEYSTDNCAVSIAVDTSKLLSLHYEKQKVEGLNVEYVKELCIEDELKKVLGRHNEFYFPFVLKSKLSDEFAFENEYRLYLTLLDTDGRFIGENHQGVHVDVDWDIETFINGVYCHPYAPKIYKNNVKEYCAKYGLCFADSTTL